MQDLVLGIDVGATGMKGGLVDVEKGEMVSERFKILTPSPATPEKMAPVIAEIVNHFKYKGVIGCGFPSIIKNGVCFSAANIDQSWIGTNVAKTFSKITNCEMVVCNDADVAGMAEMSFGRGKNKEGLVMIITIGTGLGSALFMDGKLIPNTEFGHLKFKDSVAEKYCAGSIRKKLDLSYEEWGKRFNEYLGHIEHLFSPDLIILGGGTSKKFDQFSHCITIDTPVKPAKMKNNAGIIGAAVLAKKKSFDIVSKPF